MWKRLHSVQQLNLQYITVAKMRKRRNIVSLLEPSHIVLRTKLTILRNAMKFGSIVFEI